MTELLDKVEIYKDSVSQWRWRRVSTNGKTVADGSESYHNKRDCLNQATQVNKTPYILEVDGRDDTVVE